MSNVFFISDLHFGHKRIIEFSGEHGRKGSNYEEHDEWIIDSWNSIITKRDLVWVLGDVAMGKTDNGIYNLSKISRLNGTKRLILGNHDLLSVDQYHRYFEIVSGFSKYKKYWLSHSPIHPIELRGKKNIHGHVHHRDIGDENYINVCVEGNIKRNGTIFTRQDELT